MMLNYIFIRINLFSCIVQFSWVIKAFGLFSLRKIYIYFWNLSSLCQHLILKNLLLLLFKCEWTRSIWWKRKLKHLQEYSSMKKVSAQFFEHLILCSTGHGLPHCVMTCPLCSYPYVPVHITFSFTCSKQNRF